MCCKWCTLPWYCVPNHLYKCPLVGDSEQSTTQQRPPGATFRRSVYAFLPVLAPKGLLACVYMYVHVCYVAQTKLYQIVIPLRLLFLWFTEWLRHGCGDYAPDSVVCSPPPRMRPSMCDFMQLNMRVAGLIFLVMWCLLPAWHKVLIHREKISFFNAYDLVGEMPSTYDPLSFHW